MGETEDKIRKINNLKSDIGKLDYFIRWISSRMTDRFDTRWSGIVLKTYTLVRTTLFGSLYFGCGTHEQNIDIPPSLCKEIHRLAVKQQIEKEKELNKALGL